VISHYYEKIFDKYVHVQYCIYMNNKKDSNTTLKEELGFTRPLIHPAHEPVLAIVYTATLLQKSAGRLLRGHGLTDAQFNVLMLLHHQGEAGRMSQIRLGRLLLVNRSNVTGLVDRMERDSLVRREDDPGDRRVNLVAITDKGEQMLAAAMAQYYPMLEKVMAGLDGQERGMLIKLLARVRAQLE
jgi:DNA-binding MarR family transcriptional regulator